MTLEEYMNHWHTRQAGWNLIMQTSSNGRRGRRSLTAHVLENPGDATEAIKTILFETMYLQRIGHDVRGLTWTPAPEQNRPDLAPLVDGFAKNKQAIRRYAVE